MVRFRHSLLILSLLTAGLTVTSALAVTLDSSVQEALADKLDGDTVPLLMILDNPADLGALELRLEGLTPDQRRLTVLDHLRAHAETAEADFRADLAVAAVAGRIEHITSLYLANAVLLRADRRGVDAMAAGKAAGTLFHDLSYDLITSVMDPHRAVDDVATAATGRANVWSVEWINANDVWGLGYTGAGIVVGHIDSGVYLTHNDIAGNLWINAGEIAGNGLDDDNNGYVDDVHGYDFGDDDGNPNDDSASPGHGTHTAGTVAGDGTNGTNTGVAPGAKIMALKTSASDGTGTLGSIWQSYQYIIENGARVITMSLGVPGNLSASLMRTERMTCNGLRAAGITVFNSAGNDHGVYAVPIEFGLTARVPSPWNPIPTVHSSLGGVIAVGGTGFNSNTAYSASSRGPCDWGEVDPWNDWDYPSGPGLIKPDVSAPAVGVNSLTIPNGYSGNTWSGTSMACPHAAGLAALMLEKNPSLSPAGIDSIMEITALDLGAAGKDNQFGSGRIDALAAVNGVPTASMPHLTLSNFTILDAGGDGVVDPGENFDVVFTVANNSPVEDGLSVTGGLAVPLGGSVSVLDGSGAFGTIPRAGGSGDNSGDVFSLTAAPGAIQGEAFTMLLTLYAQNGYQKTIDASFYVGLPEFRTHNVGAVEATVTDAGSLGFMSSDQIEGSGFGPSGGNGLFIGSFWAGTDQSYICNHDYTEAAPYEWQVVTSPNGRVKDLGAVISDQDFVAIYDDSGHAAAKNLVVTQESFAFAGTPNDDFIILRYTVRNDGAGAVSSYYTGIFCDWDIANSGANRGGVDAARRASYIYPDGGGAHFGVALLDPTTASNLTMINNPTYVYPNGYVEDSMKGRHLRGILSVPTTATADDWSALTACGPLTINAGEEAVFVYAMVWGADLADFQANIDAAAAINLVGPTAVPEGLVPRGIVLDQNAPNPFNPRTEIRFAVERDQTVRLAVYNLGGELVDVLANRVFAQGEHRVVWDGTDDEGSAMPSGLYLYRIESDGRSQPRKMMLVR